MASSLDSATVLVTGAASSTGSDLASALVRAGYTRLVLADDDLPRLEACRDAILKEKPTVQVHVDCFDRASEDDVGKLFATAVQKLGNRIDIAVHVVSQKPETQSTTGSSVELYDRSVKHFQRGAFLLERASLRQFLKQDINEAWDCRGTIVNVVDYGPTPLLVDYPVAAAVGNAIIGITKTDACDYAQDRIRVNCVTAGEVMISKPKPELPGGPPLPRKGTPRDVSSAVIGLVSKESSWMTGVVLPVDGGRGLNHFWV